MSRTTEHVTAIDFPNLLPAGNSENAKASQLMKIAQRSPDRYRADTKQQQPGQHKTINKNQRRRTIATPTPTQNHLLSAEDVAIEASKEQQRLVENKKNESLIAQLTNAKKAQERFDQEREKSKEKKQKAEEIQRIKQQQMEKREAWIRRQHKALYYHAGRGDLHALNQLWDHVDRQVMLSIIDKCIDHDNQETVLLWAAENGRVAVVQWLVNRGCNIYGTDAHGSNVVLNACRKGKIGCVKYLFDKYKFAARLVVDSYKNGMVIAAIQSGRADFLQFIHEEFHLDLEKKNELRETPFHIACAIGNIEMCQYMLEQCVDPAVLGYDKKNCYHYAASGNHLKVLEFLHEHCPEIDLRGLDRFGHSVLWHCEHSEDQAQAAKTVKTVQAMLKKC